MTFLAVALLALTAAQMPQGPVADTTPPLPPDPVPDTAKLIEVLSCPEAFDLRQEVGDRQPWLGNRISRCFFGPIKRPPYYHDELADDIDYYPDAYLERLAREGVNGLWLTIEFRDLAETSFTRRPPTAAKKLAKLRRTVEKCAKYGIKVWLFSIEPSEMDFRKDPLALAHPDWIGCTYDDLMGTMCAAHPEVRRYLEESVRDIFTQVPGLGGLINISNGERVTSCLSLCETSWFTCPRCTKLPTAELHHLVTRAMAKGMRAANPRAELISWIYRSAPLETLPNWVAQSARTTPEGVVQQNNFETGVVLEQVGRKHVGGDYWLSCPGPSAAFADVAAAARGADRRLSAKIQVSCSHEIATIPVLPVPGLLYRKFKGMHDVGVTDAMYCWYFGSAPGIMNRAAGLLAYDDFSDGEDEFLERLAAADWGKDAPTMAKVWRLCSDAFAQYPLSNQVQYYGPYHQGVAWPLRPDVELRPLGDSWQPNQAAAGDLVGECLSDFTLEEVETISERMLRTLDPLEPLLRELERNHADNAERVRDLGLVRAFRCHLESARDIFRFYRLRRDAVAFSRAGKSQLALRLVDEMRAIVQREWEITQQMRKLCVADARLGYHSEAENYLYSPAMFDWRQQTLRQAQGRLGEIRGEIAAGRGYPLSPLEKAAPTFPGRIDADGSLVLEGEAKGKGDVVVWLYDLCGTCAPRSYRVTPKDGRFRVVVPAKDWDNDPCKRPAWMEIHQGCDYRGDSWRWPARAEAPWRWFQGDRFGFCSARIVVSEQ